MYRLLFIKREKIKEFMQGLKDIAKWILRPEQRVKVKREIQTRKQQDLLLPQLYPATAKKLVVFFLDSANIQTGKETVSGGLLSIHSLFEESSKFKDVHGAEVLLCTIRGAHLYFEFSTFKSPNRVFRYQQLVNYFGQAEEIIAHLPEYMVEYFLGQLERGELGYLTSRKLHLNILNQNI